MMEALVKGGLSQVFNFRKCQGLKFSSPNTIDGGRTSRINIVTDRPDRRKGLKKITEKKDKIRLGIIIARIQFSTAKFFIRKHTPVKVQLD